MILGVKGLINYIRRKHMNQSELRIPLIYFSRQCWRWSYRDVHCTGRHDGPNSFRGGGGHIWFCVSCSSTEKFYGTNRGMFPSVPFSLSDSLTLVSLNSRNTVRGCLKIFKFH